MIYVDMVNWDCLNPFLVVDYPRIWLGWNSPEETLHQW